MVRVKVEQYRDEVIVLRPVYTDRGNATELWLNSGEVLQDMRGLKAVLSALAGIYAVDLKAQKKHLREALNHGGILPLYLGKRVFIPLKMRQVVTDNDAVYGYVDLDFIKGLDGEKKERICWVRLKTGEDIKLCSTLTTAVNSRHLGEKLAECLQREQADKVEELKVMESLFKLVQSMQLLAERLERLDTDVAEDEGGYG